MGIESFITDYGLIAVFLGCFLEGETAAIAGGVMAHHGYLSLWHVAAVAATGAFMADFGFFLTARRYQQHPWMQRQLARPVVARAMGSVNRNPHKLASVFRFIPGMRIIGPLVLAQSGIATRRFAAHAAVSAVTWALAYAIFGVAIGEFMARVLRRLSRPEHIAVAAIAALVIAGGAAIWHLRRKRNS